MNLGWPLARRRFRLLRRVGRADLRGWAFHAIVGGFGFLLVMPWLGRALAAVQLRLAAALLS